MPRKYKPCIYCADGIGMTNDHVPPKSWFAQPVPTNLISVPCCEKCRVEGGKHDELMLHLFTSMADTEIHPGVANELAPRRDREFARNPAKAKKTVDYIVETPYGPAFNLNTPAVDSFFERVSRAVLYDALGLKYFEKADFLWTINRDFSDFDKVFTFKKIRGNVFGAALPNRFADDGYFLLSFGFYEYVVFICKIKPAKELQPSDFVHRVTV